jgi:DNA topoisomerase VI subunit A
VRVICSCLFQVRPSDLDKFNLPAQCRLPMTEHDKKMGEELLKEPFITRNPRWVQELELMLKTGEKAEIQVWLVLQFISLRINAEYCRL